MHGNHKAYGQWILLILWFNQSTRFKMFNIHTVFFYISLWLCIHRIVIMKVWCQQCVNKSLRARLEIWVMFQQPPGFGQMKFDFRTICWQMLTKESNQKYVNTCEVMIFAPPKKTSNLFLPFFIKMHNEASHTTYFVQNHFAIIICQLTHDFCSP